MVWPFHWALPRGSLDSSIGHGRAGRGGIGSEHSLCPSRSGCRPVDQMHGAGHSGVGMCRLGSPGFSCEVTSLGIHCMDRALFWASFLWITVDRQSTTSEMVRSCASLHAHPSVRPGHPPAHLEPHQRAGVGRICVFGRCPREQADPARVRLQAH